MNIMQVNLAHTQLIPTPNQSTNYFEIIKDTMWDDDEETVVLSNLSKDKHYCNNTTSTEMMTDDEDSVENKFAPLKYADDTVMQFLIPAQQHISLYKAHQL